MSDGNSVIPFSQWVPAPADAFKDSPVNNSSFTNGIGMSWPILTIKGKEFGWRFRGIEHTYKSPDPRAGGQETPDTSIEVVLVAAANRISKVYYEGGYVPKERKPPTCWSADGLTPDEAVPAEQKQCGTCRACPQNVMGSVVTDAGKRAKRCSDNKRLAVVTLRDLENADFGGPFMLRLPPGSFSNYTPYVSALAGRHYHPYMVVTRLAFESGVSHPKVTFFPVRPVTAAEAAIIVQHQKNPIVNEMLNDKAMGAFLDPMAEVEVGVEAGVASLPDAPTNGASAWDKPATVTKVHVPETPKTLPPKDVQTPEQEEIAKLKAQLAAAEAVEKEPEPPKVVLTPEQLEIQALKAQLAEAEAAKSKRGRPRSKPVGPPTVTTAVTTDEPAPDPVGNALSDRIAKLAGQNKQ